MKRKVSRNDNIGYALDALARSMDHRAEVDDFRQANCMKRRAFMGGALRLDDRLLDDNGNEKESAFLSDGGRGAEAIRLGAEEECERGESAAWLVEFHRVVNALGDVERRIVHALMRDPRPQVASRLAATNRQRVYRTMAKLRVLLVHAHELWAGRRV